MRKKINEDEMEKKVNEKVLITVNLKDLKKAGLEAVHRYPEASQIITMYIRIREAWEAGKLSDDAFSILREQVKEKFKDANVPWRIWFSKSGKEEFNPTKCPSCGSSEPTEVRAMILRLCFGQLYPVKVCKQCDDTLNDFEVLLSVLPMNRWNAARRFVYGGTPRQDGKIFSPVAVSDVIARRGKLSHYKNTKNLPKLNPELMKHANAIALAQQQMAESKIAKRHD